MSNLVALFKNVAGFRDYVPYVSSDLELDELTPSEASAKKQICNIITPGIWARLLQEEDTDIFKYLKLAYGNLIMHKAIIFTAVAKRMSGGADVYKHELETMRRQYIDNYYNAMDSLILELDTSGQYSDLWHKTENFRFLEQLKIKTTAEFNCLYGIDMSYLFFFRTMPIQHEVLDEMVGTYFDQIESRKKELETKLKRALAFMVISIAVTRFDITELPVTIRNLFDEQKSRGESSVLSELAVSLQAKAMDVLRSIELALSEPDGNSIDPDTTFNRETDKIYLMS